MSKRKKHTYADRLKYMHMLEEGYSIDYIANNFGINHSLLKLLWERYQQEGLSALERKCNTRARVEIKLKVIKDYEENHLSLV